MDASGATVLSRGRYAARLADGPADVEAAQRLRHLVFVERAGLTPCPDGREADGFDPICRHVLVEDRRGGAPVCCFRLMALQNGAGIGASYAAQFYDLTALRLFGGPMLELGRFCIHPAHCDADVLRVAWGALTWLVDAEGIAMLFGCASFRGTDAPAYRDSFALLAARHLAPARWRPGVRAPDVHRFAPVLRHPDERRALQAMPPLLRSYLAMGGRVSDHAVIDRAMNTMHVFTGVEVAAIPAARARALRAVAGQGS